MIPAWQYNIKHILDGQLRTNPDLQMVILRWLAAYVARLIAQGGIPPKKTKTRQG